ncbi:hypothetical protein MMC07_004464 [Pseudocyphellaria aurata]|nr:hypothetical protein [Pseudocyphellaria aurata]
MSSADAQQGSSTTATSQITGKRKRVGSTDETGSAKDDQDDGDIPRQQNQNLHDFLLDIVEILRSHDTTPSILDYPIASVTGDGETHDAKRTKLSEPAETPTIASRVISGIYANVEDAAADIEAVVSRVIQELQQKGSTTNEQRLSAHMRDLRAEVALASAFKKRFDNLVLREMIQRPQIFSSTDRNVESALAEASRDGRSTKIPVLGGSNDVSARAVLTLYGSAPQPKQLFSSLQRPLGIESKQWKTKRGSDMPTNMSNDALSTTILAPSRDLIREPALPNGISVTKVIPVHSTNSSDGKQQKTPTLGELFPPPPNLAPLNPPKQSRHTATRSSSVNWYNPSEPVASNRPNRRDSYSMQPLTTGQWLTYNIAPSSTQMSSPEAKRKQRDRALSFGEPQSTLSQEVMVAHSEAKEDALFRSVYSSFAPDRDNAGALISDQTKNRLWWKRVGENRYQDHLKTDYPPLPDEDVEVNGTSEHVGSVSEDEFKGVLDDWVPEELPPELKPTPEAVLETPATTEEVNEVLQGISDLLETLNSYQRNRNLSLANNARTITNSQLVSTSGSPTSPSSAELDVFTMLRSQLALMVSTLPPYTLAKLDGDKLGVLNISTKIQIQNKQYTGTMEEDEVVAKAKQSTSTPAASYAARNANANLSVPARSSSYLHAPATPSQPVQRPSYATQPRPVNTSSSYLPNQQYSSRPASSNHYFSGTSHPSYSSQRPTATTSERYSYSASQQYSQRPAQPTQNQQSNGYRPYPVQNGQSYSQQYSTPQQSTSSTSGSGHGAHTQRPSQPGYQQRAMNAQSYSTGVAARDASPPKPSASFTPQHPRTAYAGQGQIPSQQRPQLYHQHSAQYGSQTAVPRQVNGAGVTLSSGQHTYMTAEEQSALMNRQKAQLAEQQSSAARQSSGTPQPANGHYTGPQNGAPAVQPNGVPVGQGQ